MTDRFYKWVPYDQMMGHLARGWQLGQSYLTDTLHARFAIMMWRDVD